VSRELYEAGAAVTLPAVSVRITTQYAPHEAEEDRIVGAMMRGLQRACLEAWGDRSAALWDSIVADAIQAARHRGLDVSHVTRIAGLLRPDFGGRR
jgi:hypothetical protein